MSVQQYYYTSWVDKSPGGEAGFHMRGKSPGISPEDERLLRGLISYEIPPRLDPRQIATHPIALRYMPVTPQRSVLLCCQSTGADEQGRTGNFFAHATLLEPDVFTHTPPAFYWKSPFWLTRDDTPGTQIPALPSFDAEPALDLDEVWRFIGDPRRREWFYRLLCAVIHSRSTHRRVVIIDSPEHVALWAAGVSLMLPSHYRPLLSFATYLSDPYSSSYLLTGVRSDMGFQASQAENLSFFIMDTESDRIGEVADSHYARFACDCADPERYESRMLNLLSLCDRRFPPVDGIGDELDDAAAYYERASASSGPVSPSARRALTAAITSLQRDGTVTSEQADDLRTANLLLTSALAESPDAELLGDYEHVASLLNTADPEGEPARLARDLALATQLIATGSVRAGSDISEAIRRISGDDAVAVGLNAPDYLRDLSRICAQAALSNLLAVWQSVGQSVRATPASAPAVATTLKRIAVPSGATSASMTRETEQMVSALADATHADAAGWLTRLAADTTIPSLALWAYYYALVHQISPEERAQFRARMPQATALPEYEIKRDLRGAPTAIGMDILERWAIFAQTQPNGGSWVIAGLDSLWRTASAREQSDIAKHALTRLVIARQLDAPRETTLLHAALAGVPLARPTALDGKICQDYRNDDRLTASERTLMIGVFAMNNGQLDHRSAEELRRRFSSLSPEQYATESREFIMRFFEQDVTRDAHAEMVIATYNMRYSDVFWQSYGSALMDLMFDPRRVKQFVSLLGFWFDASLSMLGGYPYVVQTFFLSLALLFEAAQKERGYRDVARDIDQYASREQWYPLVRGLIMPERKGILGLFRR